MPAPLPAPTSALAEHVTVCRGYKVVVKFFPNEAANLEPVVDMLLKLEEQVVFLTPPSSPAPALQVY